MIDGSYQSWIGQFALGKADVVVWLDLPMRVWLPRLLRRTIRRARSGEELWEREPRIAEEGVREPRLADPFALRHFRARRQIYPERFAAYDLVRLRSQVEVDRFLRSAEPAP